jgi:hypothetical protein
MRTMKTVALAGTLAVLMSGAAFADPAARANTSDPNSAPMASPTGGMKQRTNDPAARANTADPNSAPMAREAGPKRGANDAAGRANTADPNSATTGAGSRTR